MKPNNHTAIILAGGQSRRMGRNKALLPLPGNPQQTQVTLVEHMASLLLAHCQEVVLVARDEQQMALYDFISNVRCVIDQVPDVGPLMGVYSGLCSLSSTHALVTAVDMPFVQPAMIAFLLEQWREDELLVPVVAGIPQVLCAVYPTALLPVIEQRLCEGRHDPRSLLTAAHVRYVEEAQLRLIDPELRSFINLNTPDEWRNAGYM